MVGDGITLPFIVRAEDGNRYVTKVHSRQEPAYMLFTEQVMPLIGRFLGAPTQPVTVLDINLKLLEGTSAQPMRRPYAHGSRIDFKCTSRMWLEEASALHLRQDFAAIAVFFRMLAMNDHQLVYSKDIPKKVLSVDHGGFLPFEVDTVWTTERLRAWSQENHAHVEMAYREMVDKVGLTQVDFDPVLEKLSQLSESDVTVAVSHPPDEWGVTANERTVLAEYIWSRRDIILQESWLT